MLEEEKYVCDGTTKNITNKGATFSGYISDISILLQLISITYHREWSAVNPRPNFFPTIGVWADATACAKIIFDVWGDDDCDDGGDGE